MARTKAKSPSRRARRPTATRRRTATKATGTARRQTKLRQRFVVSHHREEDFEGGLRRYAKYRDLGIAQATNGMVRAHVIRFVPPCRPEEVSKRHYHDVDFQMVYVLKGWIKTARGARLLGRLRGARSHPTGGFRDGGTRIAARIVCSRARRLGRCCDVAALSSWSAEITRRPSSPLPRRPRRRRGDPASRRCAQPCRGDRAGNRAWRGAPCRGARA